MPNLGLPRSSILRHKKDIERLFQEGSFVFKFPISAAILLRQDDPTLVKPPILVSFSVSKRYFKRAVDRNLIKRRMREAYRIHQNSAPYISEGQLHVMFIYKSKKIESFQKIQFAILNIIQQGQEKNLKS